MACTSYEERKRGRDPMRRSNDKMEDVCGGLICGYLLIPHSSVIINLPPGKLKSKTFHFM